MGRGVCGGGCGGLEEYVVEIAGGREGEEADGGFEEVACCEGAAAGLLEGRWNVNLVLKRG